MQTTAAELLTRTKSIVLAMNAHMNNRPSDTPRGEWRGRYDGPTLHQNVLDTGLKSRPVRALTASQAFISGNPYLVHVSRVTGRLSCIEEIDLRAADADVRLARYLEA